jgi:hypothetical protein
MAYWRIWTCDVIRGQYAYATASVVASSAQNTLDGDPSTYWQPGASAGTVSLTVETGASVKTHGFGVIATALAGKTISLHTKAGSTWTPQFVDASCDSDQFVVELGAAAASVVGWKLEIDAPSAATRVHIFSALSDYGFGATGSGTYDAGYGRLILGDEGGVRTTFVKIEILEAAPVRPGAAMRTSSAC